MPAALKKWILSTDKWAISFCEEERRQETRERACCVGVAKIVKLLCSRLFDQSFVQGESVLHEAYGVQMR